MSRNIFGWSYPPGCSGPPDDDYDDTICCQCNRKLPEDSKEGDPAQEGFCCWACAREYTKDTIERYKRSLEGVNEFVDKERAAKQVKKYEDELAVLEEKSKGQIAPEPIYPEESFVPPPDEEE